MEGILVLLALILATRSQAMGVPRVSLNNGMTIPAIALGTYLGHSQHGVVKSEKKQLRDVILKAIDLGYNHFDTASIYETESEIGEAMNIKMRQGVIKREDIFVTTKLWNTHHNKSQVIPALKESLKKLDLEYVDLYLMHWPVGINEDSSFSNVDFMETWTGMEDAFNNGLTKAIGVSNFNKEQLSRVVRQGNIKCSVLQIEIHPQLIQSDLVKYAQSKNITVMGYSPLGSLVSRWGLEHNGPHINDPLLTVIAKKYRKSTPQIVLRWLVDRNIIPIPKTITPKRLQENIDIFNFKLTDLEISAINGFNSNTRYTLPSFWQNHSYYPFEKVDKPIANPF